MRTIIRSPDKKQLQWKHSSLYGSLCWQKVYWVEYKRYSSNLILSIWHNFKRSVGVSRLIECSMVEWEQNSTHSTKIGKFLYQWNVHFMPSQFCPYFYIYILVRWDDHSWPDSHFTFSSLFKLVTWLHFNEICVNYFMIYNVFYARCKMAMDLKCGRDRTPNTGTCTITFFYDLLHIYNESHFPPSTMAQFIKNPSTIVLCNHHFHFIRFSIFVVCRPYLNW